MGGKSNIAASRRGQDGVCSSRNGSFELDDSHPSPSSPDSVLVEFDNILYAERGPTAAKGGNSYELVSGNSLRESLHTFNMHSYCTTCHPQSELGVTTQYSYVPTIVSFDISEEKYLHTIFLFRRSVARNQSRKTKRMSTLPLTLYAFTYQNSLSKL